MREIEKQLDRQQVRVVTDKNSVVFQSTDIDNPFEFEWDDIFYLCEADIEERPYFTKEQR